MKLFWYSSATGVTGEKLANDLGMEHHKSRELPNLDGVTDLICWGCKTDRNYDIPGHVRVLNHPNAIRINRNKLKALQKMAESDETLVPEFKLSLTDEDIIAKRWVGRTRYHQGGKGFWLILNKADYDNAVNEGAQYFQEHLNIKNEYRLHVFKNEVIYAVKKVQHDNPVESWKAIVKEDLDDKIDDVNDDVLNRILTAVAKRITLPDRIIRSNKRGWKFSKVNRVADSLADKAIKALQAIGLDFGAVDMVETLEGAYYVLEVNTGPGLKGSPYDCWKAKFTEYINNLNDGLRRGNGAERAERAERAEVRKVHAENAENPVNNGNVEIIDSIKGLVVNLDLSNVSEEDKKKINKIEINVS